jgi:hypothetical protein
MINLSVLNENELARIYLVSNTPSYLFRHYRADQSVQELSSRHSAVDLLSFATQVAQLHNRTLRQVIQAYAALVAFTLKNPQVRIDDPESLKNLNWSHAILSLGGGEQITTNQFQLRSSPTVTRPMEMSAIPSCYISIEAN